MTENAPQTVVEIIAAHLADAGYRGAMDITLDVTDADTPLRRVTVRACNEQLSADRTDDARKLIEHLADAVGITLDPDATRTDERRAPRAPRTPRQRNHGPGTIGDYLRRWFTTTSLAAWTIEEAHEGIREMGWTTTAAVPLDTVRPLIAQFARDGVITRLQRGLYSSAPGHLDRAREGEAP